MQDERWTRDGRKMDGRWAKAGWEMDKRWKNDGWKMGRSIIWSLVPCALLQQSVPIATLFIIDLRL